MTTSGRQSRARGATPRELADTLAKLLGGGSVLLALWLEVEETAMTPDEADAVAEPLARIINRVAWGKALAKRLVGADDYLALSLALFAYGSRIYPLVAAKVSQPRVRVARPIPTPAPAPIRQEKPVQSASNGTNGHDGGQVRFTDLASASDAGFFGNLASD